jgi:hypothetical protein
MWWRVPREREHCRRWSSCSRDQEAGAELREERAVSTAAGISIVRFVGCPIFIVHFIASFVRLLSKESFHDRGGPCASCSMVERSRAGMGETGGPRIPGLHPQTQFRLLSPVICPKPEAGEAFGLDILPLRVSQQELFFYFFLVRAFLLFAISWLPLLSSPKVFGFCRLS